jgi:hypothetical protein
MRRSAAAAILAAATLQVLTAHVQNPPGHLYRGPWLLTRPATFVDSPNGALLEFSRSWLRWSAGPTTLETWVRSRSLRPIPGSGILLRLAFGPTTDGMITFRLRPRTNADFPGLPAQITPNGGTRQLSFAIVPEDRRPGVLALTPEMQIVFTVERIDNDENQAMFDNPDATELLWEALGRPSLVRQ